MSDRINTQQFTALMTTLADAWASQATDTAVACFTPDAVYMQPPNIQFYTGHDQLRAYFGALEPDTYLTYQHLWFNEAEQTGCVEFSFGVHGRPKADHGIAVLQLDGGLIAHWREYVQPGPADFTAFTATHGKDWEWHIGNYP